MIVQRHLNAMLLADFLWKQIEKAGGQGDLNKLNMEWWALPKDSSLADAFMAAGWTVVAQLDNDPTGVSATVFQDEAGKRYLASRVLSGAG